jgi:hypothetical protein
MSNHNASVQIDKAAWQLVENIKNTLSVNVTVASRSDIKIEPAVLAKLLMIVNASVEQGYQQGSRVFSKTVEEALNAIPQSVEKHKKR